MTIKKIISSFLVVVMLICVLAIAPTASAETTQYGQVTYDYSLVLPEEVENFQATLHFDHSSYQVATDNNGDYMVSFPNLGDNVVYNVKNNDGRILFNATDFVNRYNFTLSSIVISVTFDIQTANVASATPLNLDIIETVGVSGTAYSTESGTDVTQIPTSDLTSEVSNVNTDFIDFNFRGASIHLVEPWEVIFGTSVSANALALADDYGAVVVHENNYTAGMTGSDMYDLSSAKILSSKNGKARIVSGVYIYSTLSEGLYCYDMDTDYYISTFVEINGTRYFDTVSSRNYLERIQANISSETNADRLALYTDMYNTYIADIDYISEMGYTPATVPKDNRKTLHGSDYTMNGTESTNTISMTNAGASIHLIEPWGLSFAESIPTSDLEGATEYGFVLMSQDNYTQDMTGTQMITNANGCVYSSTADSNRYIVPELYMSNSSVTYYTATQIEDIYTYMMNVKFYGKFYVVKDGNYYFSDTFSRSVYDRVNVLKDSTSVGSTSKKLYTEMYQMFLDAYKIQYGVEFE